MTKTINSNRNAFNSSKGKKIKVYKIVTAEGDRYDFNCYSLEGVQAMLTTLANPSLSYEDETDKEAIFAF